MDIVDKGRSIKWGFLILALVLLSQIGAHRIAPVTAYAIADSSSLSGVAPAHNPTLYALKTASGDAYYVAINGDDSNPGTLASPWKTIQHAVDHVTPGDNILVREGTYNESVRLSVSGQQGRPITLTSYRDEPVTIDGGEAPALHARWDGTQYWIIEGFTLDSSAEYTVEFGTGYVYSSDHCTTRNNYIRGAVMVSGSYNVFQGNEVDGSQHRGSEDGVQEVNKVSHHNLYRNNHIHHFNSRGIWSLSFTHDSIFENNHVHHIGVDRVGDDGGQGIDLDGFSTVVWRHIVRNNHIHDCGLNGLSLENAFDGVVEDNIIHDIPGKGIGVINYGGEIGDGWGTDNRCQVGGEHNQYGDTDGDNDCRGNITGNIIRQNLIYNTGTYGAIVIWSAGGINILGNTIYVGAGNRAAGILISWEYSPEIGIQSNIISECDWGAINIKDTDSLVEDSNNLIYQPRGKADYLIGSSEYSLSQYQSMSGKGRGSIAADARFIDPSGHDFRLLSDSPAIDAGVDIGLTTDMDGRSRPQGPGYEIGAYEHGSLRQMTYLPIIRNPTSD